MPPVVVPTFPEVGSQFAAATTLRTLMSQAGWGDIPVPSEKPLYHWVMSIAEQIAILDGQGTIPHSRPEAMDALESVSIAHSRMTDQHAVTVSYHMYLKANLDNWLLSNARTRCYEKVASQRIVVVSDSTLIWGKRKPGAPKHSLTPYPEFKIGLDPSKVPFLWAQSAATAAELGECIRGIREDKFEHLVLYWAVNDCVKWGHVQDSGRETAAPEPGNLAKVVLMDDQAQQHVTDMLEDLKRFDQVTILGPGHSSTWKVATKVR